MIVNQSSAGVSIIYHAAHGLLAGKIANRLKSELRFEYWFDFLIAVSEHDDRQLNFEEKEYLSENGIPIHFTEEKKKVSEIIRRMKRVTKSAINKSMFVRLLISHHLEFLYGHMRSESKRIKNFFQNEKALRKQALSIYKINKAEVSHAYQCLKFCDRLSLLLCMDKVPTPNRKLEINTSIDNKTYFVEMSQNQNINVEPWVFDIDKFELSVETRFLNAASFSSEKKFKEVLESTAPNLKSWILSKKSKN